jgi:hypothetical protein
MTAYAISADHTTIVCAISIHGKVYSMQFHGMRFASDLRQIGGFLLVLWFPSPIN